MRLITYSTVANPVARLAVRVGHRVLDVEAASRVDGEPLPSSMKALLREGRGAISRVQALAKAAQSSAGRFSSAMFEERAIRFLPPVPDPDSFVCVEMHQRGGPGGKEGAITGVARLGSTLVGHNAKVARPAGVADFACRPELVFVIARRVEEFGEDSDAMDYVIGVTVLNNLADAGPIGPEIVTLDEVGDPYDVWLTCSVNGEERLRASTAEQAWNIDDILAHFSRSMQIEPGDMFATGALGDTAGQNAKDLSLKPGDIVECGIEGITTLRTTIVAAQ
jgi:hypothetical protein